MNLQSVFLKYACVATWLVLSAVAPLQAKEAALLAEDPVVEKRLVHISEELRCLVCQNESLASSRAELANDLREEVRKLIREDKSDSQIKELTAADTLNAAPKVTALAPVLLHQAIVCDPFKVVASAESLS